MKQILIITFLIISNLLHAQDSLISSIATRNVTTFTKHSNKFSGAGWEKLLKEVKEHNNVAIGEDHFFNEIPFFVNQIASEVAFDNFFCEIDPYSAKIIESKIKSLSATELKEYAIKYGNVFSFYALEPEFELLKNLVNSGTNIYGTDQIILIADRLVCAELKSISKNPDAIKIYTHIELQSEIYFNEFLKDQSKPFYFFTPEFKNEFDKVMELQLGDEEKEVLSALALSRKIYTGTEGGNHHLRIQLMKNNLMKEYNHMRNSKNLFKYGAGHLPKGESFFEIYDLGNLINNISDSHYEESLHIIVIGKSGMQGVPFKGIPNQKLNPEDENYKSLHPFFKATDDSENWHLFDLNTIVKEIKEGDVILDDEKLRRIIKGFDYLIVIPTVTAAPFIY